MKIQQLLLAKKFKMSKRKNQATPLEDKYQAIKRFENKEATQDQIAQELGVARCSITRWCGVQRETIVQTYENSLCSGARKRIRASKYEKIDESLFEWFKEKRAINLPINGPILTAKAMDFAALHNDTEFKALSTTIFVFNSKMFLNKIITFNEHQFYHFF